MAAPVLDRPAAAPPVPPTPARSRATWPRSLALVGAAVLLLALVGAGVEAVAARRDAQAFPPPGRVVALPGGGTRHLVCAGAGAPTIVLEAGVGESALTWADLQPRLAAGTRVCAYDRAGYGWSGHAEPAVGPRTAADRADDLASLLTTAGERGPFVLVARSLGAHVTRSFVERHGRDVTGVVLLDPAVPGVSAGGPVATSGLRYRLAETAGRLGALRAFGPSVVRAVAGIGVPDAMAAAAPVVASPTAMATAVDDLRLAGTEPSPVAAGRWGGLPLVVVSAGSAGATEREAHARLAGLSTAGVHLVADGTGTAIHHERPDLVVATALSVVGGARVSGG